MEKYFKLFGLAVATICVLVVIGIFVNIIGWGPTIDLWDETMIGNTFVHVFGRWEDAPPLFSSNPRPPDMMVMIPIDKHTRNYVGNPSKTAMACWLADSVHNASVFTFDGYMTAIN